MRSEAESSRTSFRLKAVLRAKYAAFQKFTASEREATLVAGNFCWARIEQSIDKKGNGTAMSPLVIKNPQCCIAVANAVKSPSADRVDGQDSVASNRSSRDASWPET